MVLKEVQDSRSFTINQYILQLLLYMNFNEFPVYWFVLGCISCSCKSSLIPGMLYSWVLVFNCKFIERSFLTLLQLFLLQIYWYIVQTFKFPIHWIQFVYWFFDIFEIEECSSADWNAESGVIQPCSASFIRANHWSWKFWYIWNRRMQQCRLECRIWGDSAHYTNGILLLWILSPNNS